MDHQAPLTLDSVIDPELQESLPTQDGSSGGASQNALFDGPRGSQSAEPESESGRNGKAKRKRKPLPPGSAADFKRKEANRLAAERSRSRAAEKTKALNSAYALLSSEHEDLLSAILDIETTNQIATEETERKAREERERREVEAQVEAAIAVAQQEIEAGGGERDERSILAALMSSGMGMEGFEGVGDDWVHGVESLMKEVETSGRLGELAAAAAVPADSSSIDQPEASGSGASPHTEMPTEKEAEMSETINKIADELLEQKDETPRRMLAFTYNSSEAAAATHSAVAVVLNAEIERAVRDEVALTRQATSRIESEIAKANGEAVEVEEGPLRLPEDVFGQDQEGYEKRLEAVEASRAALEEEVRQMVQRVIAAREAKGEVEAQVGRGVEELHKIMAIVDEAERAKIMDVMKSIRGYIGNHVWGLEDEATPDDMLLGTAYSTPAIARRRRGRPPKHSFPLRYNHASLIYPSLPIDSPISTATLADPSAPPPRRKRVRPSQVGVFAKKSKLSQQILPATRTDQPVAGSSAAADEHDQLLSQLQDAHTSTRIGPDGSPLDPAFDSSEWTDSVLSRLKKGGPGSCDVCGRTETSVWRKIVLGGDDYRVCNACGLYHSKFGVIRPPSLWGDGAAVKKRRAILGPDDGRRNRKVKKMLQNADQAKAQADAEAETETGEGDVVADGSQAELQLDAMDGMEGAEGVEELQEVEVEERREPAEPVAEEQEPAAGTQDEQSAHVDVDEQGFEAIEQELRGLHGDQMFEMED